MNAVAYQTTGLIVCSGAHHRNIKAPLRWPLWGECSCDRWIMIRVINLPISTNVDLLALGLWSKNDVCCYNWSVLNHRKSYIAQLIQTDMWIHGYLHIFIFDLNWFGQWSATSSYSIQSDGMEMSLFYGLDFGDYNCTSHCTFWIYHVADRVTV